MSTYNRTFIKKVIRTPANHLTPNKFIFSPSIFTGNKSGALYSKQNHNGMNCLHSTDIERKVNVKPSGKLLCESAKFYLGCFFCNSGSRKRNPKIFVFNFKSCMKNISVRIKRGNFVNSILWQNLIFFIVEFKN